MNLVEFEQLLERKLEEVLDRKLDEVLDRKLDQKLDKKFAQFEQRIVLIIDQKIDERLIRFEERIVLTIDQKVEDSCSRYFGIIQDQMRAQFALFKEAQDSFHGYVERRFNETDEKIFLLATNVDSMSLDILEIKNTLKNMEQRVVRLESPYNF